MDNQVINEILYQLLKAPETQLDPTVFPYITEAIGKEKDEDKLVCIEFILDQCAYYALASTFTMLTLDAIKEGLKQRIKWKK